MENNQHKILDVSWWTIIRIVVAAIAIYFLFLIQDLLAYFIFALIISLLFNPAINFLAKRKIPRIIAAIVVYFGIFLLLGFAIFKIAPFLFTELRDFAMKFPQYFEKISPYFKGFKIGALADFQTFTQALENMLAKSSTSFFTALGSIFGGLITTLAIFSISFFLSLEEKGIERVVGFMVPKKYHQKALDVWENTQRKVSIWFGTRVLGMIFIGVLTTITCLALNVKYAIFFGLIAGLADIIITIGPLMAGAIIALFILAISWPKAIIFVAAFILIHEIESHVITPVLSKKFLKLSPALVLMAILIGARIWGLLGSILAIPLMAMIFEFIKGIITRKEGMAEGPSVPPTLPPSNIQPNG